jgi:hypothetical protein
VISNGPPTTEIAANDTQAMVGNHVTPAVADPIVQAVTAPVFEEANASLYVDETEPLEIIPHDATSNSSAPYPCKMTLWLGSIGAILLLLIGASIGGTCAITNGCQKSNVVAKSNEGSVNKSAPLDKIFLSLVFACDFLLVTNITACQTQKFFNESMSGTIPTEIGLLTQTTFLDFTNNTFVWNYTI